MLGDNIFYGNGFIKMLREAVRTADEEQKATVFGYWVAKVAKTIKPSARGELEITTVNQEFR